jgi:hypothetical protein
MDNSLLTELAKERNQRNKRGADPKMHETPSPKQLKTQHGQDEDASLKLARRLQAKEDEDGQMEMDAATGGGRGAGIGDMHRDLLYDELKEMSDKYRRDCEGPPTAPWTVQTQPDGSKQRVRQAERGWDESAPVVSCSDTEVMEQLKDLGRKLGSSPLETPGMDPGICANATNAPLLRLLCSWRRHILESKFEYQKPGATSWRSTTICTSLQCWLGRRSEKGGVICAVASTRATVDSLAKFIGLQDEGAKGTSAGNAMLVCLRMGWQGGGACSESRAALQRELKKAKETDGRRLHRLGAAVVAAGGPGARRLTGLDSWAELNPWRLVFGDILAGRAVDARLRHAVLARAHLP